MAAFKSQIPPVPVYFQLVENFSKGIYKTGITVFFHHP